MKKFGMLLVSVVLVLCMAFGMTACGDNRGNGGGEGNKPEPPATPTVTTDVNGLSLIKNEKVNVTATVSNSQKSASFSLAEGDEDVVALTVSEATPNVATIEAIADGDATLTVALEGATSVTVPVTVDGILRIDGDILDQTKVFDAGETGTDDGETATFTVEHFMGDDCKLEVTSSNDAVAELSESNGTYSIKALQAGVSEITITLSAVKEETPDEGEGTPSEPDAQSDDVAVTPEYEEIYTNTLGFVCTDDWDKAAKADEISNKLLNFKEVTGGYAAYIDRANADDDFMFDLEDFDGKLHVPAVYNRKPVISLAGNQEKLGTGFFLAFDVKQGTTQISGKPTLEEIEAIEDAEAKAAAQAKYDAFELYETLYNSVNEVYLPCTLTEIGGAMFRLATASRVEVQKGSQIVQIGVQGFNEMYNLEFLNTEDMTKLKTIKNNAFDQAGHKLSDTANYKGFSLTLPASLETIEQLAFANSGIVELEFSDDGNDNVGVEIGTMAFMSSIKLQKVWLRNIRTVKNQAFWATEALKEIHVDSKILTTNLGTDNYFDGSNASGSYMSFAGIGLQGQTWNAVNIYLEGDSTVAKNVAKLVNGYNAGLGDNCGALFGSAQNAGFHNVYISTETKTSDISGYLANFYVRAADAEQDQTGYVRYKFLKWCWGPNGQGGISGADYDDNAKFTDPA